MPDGYRPASGYGQAGPLESRLRGTGRVADDLWLLAHHEVTGRPLLHARELGLGLAAGLLAELMLGERPAIRLWQGGTVMIGQNVPRSLVERHPLLKQIGAEPQLLPVRDWLLFMARTADGEVGARLEQAGYLARSRRRIPGMPARRVPVDPDWAFAPVTRVGAALDPRRPFDPCAGALAGLAVACGLNYRLGQYLNVEGVAVEAAAARLPADLERLIVHTQVAVSTAVFSRT
jgi:hypothetical protein